MPNLGPFNWVDVVLILIIGGGLLLGFTQGLLRQIIGLAALYLAMIVATQYYTPLSNFMYGFFFTTPSRFINVVAFLVIFILVSALINILAADAYQLTKLRLFPTIDQFGGSFLGLVTVIIILVLLLPILQFVSGEPLPYFENLRAGLVQGMQNSRLVAIFLLFRRDLLNAITPWLPNGQIPPIFNL